MDIKLIKEQFPIFNHYKKDEFLYLDSASTTQKHQSVLAELDNYHKKYSDRGFRVLAISTDSPKSMSKVKSYIRA